MSKQLSLPKVRICVSYVGKTAITKIFGNSHHAPIIRENVVPSVTGEILLRHAIKGFNLSLDEIKFLR